MIAVDVCYSLICFEDVWAFGFKLFIVISCFDFTYIGLLLCGLLLAVWLLLAMF